MGKRFIISNKRIGISAKDFQIKDYIDGKTAIDERMITGISYTDKSVKLQLVNESTNKVSSKLFRRNTKVKVNRVIENVEEFTELTEEDAEVIKNLLENEEKGFKSRWENILIKGEYDSIPALSIKFLIETNPTLSKSCKEAINIILSKYDLEKHVFIGKNNMIE